MIFELLHKKSDFCNFFDFEFKIGMLQGRTRNMEISSKGNLYSGIIICNTKINVIICLLRRIGRIKWQGRLLSFKSFKGSRNIWRRKMESTELL